MNERKIHLHYIDLKNFENFKEIIKKFLVKTFLKKKNRFIKNHKSQKNKTSTAICYVSKIKRNKTEINPIDKKIIKSLSFNLSDGDGSS